VGDDASDPGPVIPRSVAVGLTLLTIAMLGYMAYSLPSRDVADRVPTLLRSLWQQRVLDVWIQMVLIFAGVLGILGLLAEGKSARAKAPGSVGNGHRSVKVVPPTACGYAPPAPRSAHDQAKKEEVHV
jgi:hypothetical protein